MKMMVPTLQPKEVTANEYRAHWDIVLDHIQILYDQHMQIDSIVAKLNAHYFAMAHQTSSVRDGFTTPAHAELLEHDTQNKLADIMTLNERLWVRRMSGLANSQAAKANRLISDLEAFVDPGASESVSNDIKKLAHPAYRVPSVNEVQEAIEESTNLEMKK